MSVDNWARRESERRYPAGWVDRGRTDRDDERGAFEEGVGALVDALPSDEAVEAAAGANWDYRPEKYEKSWEYGPMRSALQAAISTVTKGDTHE